MPRYMAKADIITYDYDEIEVVADSLSHADEVATEELRARHGTAPEIDIYEIEKLPDEDEDDAVV